MNSIIKDVEKRVKDDPRPVVQAYNNMIEIVSVWYSQKVLYGNFQMSRKQIIDVCSTLVRVYEEQTRERK